MVITDFVMEFVACIRMESFLFYCGLVSRADGWNEGK